MEYIKKIKIKIKLINYFLLSIYHKYLSMFNANVSYDYSIMLSVSDTHTFSSQNQAESRCARRRQQTAILIAISFSYIALKPSTQNAMQYYRSNMQAELIIHRYIYIVVGIHHRAYFIVFVHNTIYIEYQSIFTFTKVTWVAKQLTYDNHVFSIQVTFS